MKIMKCCCCCLSHSLGIYHILGNLQIKYPHSSPGLQSHSSVDNVYSPSLNISAYPVFQPNKPQSTPELISLALSTNVPWIIFQNYFKQVENSFDTTDKTSFIEGQSMNMLLEGGRCQNDIPM